MCVDYGHNQTGIIESKIGNFLGGLLKSIKGQHNRLMPTYGAGDVVECWDCYYNNLVHLSEKPHPGYTLLPLPDKDSPMAYF